MAFTELQFPTAPVIRNLLPNFSENDEVLRQVIQTVGGKSLYFYHILAQFVQSKWAGNLTLQSALLEVLHLSTSYPIIILRRPLQQITLTFPTSDEVKALGYKRRKKTRPDFR